MNTTTIPRIIKSGRHWWIPPFPPHWEDWIGEYCTLEEAKENREGLGATINGVQWKMMLIEMEEAFEDEWDAREESLKTRLDKQIKDEL
jgi:hypothetical protein